ncbi:hypothetical protein A966_12011 [Brachyspira hampsonii 30446]|uniref:Uncharacterized protein n=1 Tax=Brachyspira hampsonii 30446 TaxID=1289135 RepID=A0A2U4EUA3_9SPIR|nr:hypothetical protein [Brachyspira hampsonii]EKV56085.1 hypothetical protein A966_12011 [Brachyspira hampsonii 30446]MBW5395740.1 hypothetical protein [Brachyspira hampsonii]OEJ18072.1 hypothetical protein A9495_06605 [Brachyspira hampsonii]
MDDKDIMDPNVYQIKKNDWEVLENDNYYIYKLLAYKLSSWSEDTYLIVKVNKENNNKEIIIDWNSKDFVFAHHKTFFRFDNDLPDNLDCKASEDRLSSIVLKPDYVYDNLLDADMLIVRASLEKSKTTRMFDISKFKDIVRK